jgi:soluble lytic murein transglycosylase
VVAGVLIASCGGSSPQAESSAKPLAATPTPSPRPTAVAVDLDLADRLAYEGRFEEAAEIYAAAAERGAGAQEVRALWSLGRMMLRLGEYRAVEQVAENILSRQLSEEDQRRALLLLGFANGRQGDLTEAQQAFERYLETGGPASSWARLQLAEIERRRGNRETAGTLVGQALAEGLAPQLETEALFLLAEIQERDDPAAAASTYRRIAAVGATDSNRAEALWRLAQASASAGASADEQAALVELLRLYPGHQRALEALAVAEVSLFERARVLFEQRVNAEAEELFAQVLEVGTAVEAGRAHYYLGILAERRGAFDEALSHYEASIDLLSTSGDALLAESMWDRALVLEGAGRLAEARDAFVSIADVTPSSPRAREGLFRGGLLSYRLGDYTEASSAWSRSLALAVGAEEIGRVHYWLGRVAQVAGDPALAATEFAAALEASPLDYYGMRAAARLGADSAGEIRNPSPPVADWAEVERWLTVNLGPEDVALSVIFLASGEFERGVELLRAGLVEEADAEFRALINKAGRQPWLLYRLARAMSEEGRPSFASWAAGFLLRMAPNPPPQLIALVYPLEYAELAAAVSEEFGLPPLLLLALVRQESLYNPGALSAASALGLTQVIPATAQEIARRLNVTGFQLSDLRRPNVSLRFGAFYLAEQLEMVGGHLPAALAAYNGGPGNALRWLKSAGRDPDIFLESIDFPETRVYVQFVLENWSLYRYAYGLTEHPLLDT